MRSPLLSNYLKHNLRRLRFVVQSGATTGGVGERRSKNKGEGIEFEDFRPYTPGDDMRRIDPHIYSRLGQLAIRQYNVSERITVTILVDLSASMGFGAPDKSNVSLALAAGLALCALASGDAVRCGVLTEERVSWFPQLDGTGRFDELERWLIEQPTGGPQRLLSALETAASKLPFGGICVLLGDLWDERLEDACDLLLSAGQDLVFLRVLSREEVDPHSLGTGPVRFVDLETGDEVEVDLLDWAFDEYERRFAAWTERLRGMILKRHGRFVDVPTDTSIYDVFQRHLRAANVIR